jgi:hypothetical protein
VTLAGDTTVDTTNLRAGKTVADSRAYILLQWAGTSTDAVAVTSAAWSSGTQGFYLDTTSRTLRLDTPAVITLHGLIGASVNVDTISFFNYDS